MKVFISHTLGDTSLANRLAADLQRSGIVAIPPDQFLTPGSAFAQKISDEIAASDAVIVLMSSEYDKSQWAEAELSLAMYQRTKGHVKLIIPVLTSKGAVVPPLLQPFTYIRAFDMPYDEMLAQIRKALASVKDNKAEPITFDPASVRIQIEALKQQRDLSLRFMRDRYERTSLVTSVVTLACVGFLAALEVLGKVSVSRFNLIASLIVPLIAFLSGYAIGSGRMMNDPPSSVEKSDQVGDRGR